MGVLGGHLNSQVFLYRPSAECLTPSLTVSSDMEQVFLRVLRAEVRRRKCPGCGNSLRRADIEASFRTDKSIQLHFRCRFCSFEGGGQFELTAEMCREAAQIATSEGEELLLPVAVTAPDLAPITGGAP